MSKLLLNLGSGNKLYPLDDHWVNVDIVEPNAAFQTIDVINDKLHLPDQKVNLNLPVFHQSDLTRLCHIDDNVADEAHAYHVCEHFYREELPGVLKEWLRVLKPGGKLCVEQPDILKCAANLLAGYHCNSPGVLHNLGILGFYGDGKPDAPYMSHKWGWMPDTLGNELARAGFVNISHVPAKTHAKEMRDFRLEAEKPNGTKE